ncbi:hypothetical protein MIMGU_mgv1a016961mg [Erythranthe guttata]|uniref:Secreted protein n=1 Tax=Erythranthe guttata TaxID=4155 RepID=A0A022QAL2_ERYGU|nr:hypothetical protein MIMGU_mgv1a016961mg [Erythranthe guttata]
MKMVAAAPKSCLFILVTCLYMHACITSQHKYPLANKGILVNYSPISRGTTDDSSRSRFEMATVECWRRGFAFLDFQRRRFNGDRLSATTSKISDSQLNK